MNKLTSTLDNPSAHATTPDRILHAFLAAWWHGDVVEAAEQFRDRFTLADHALGLEFKDKERLTGFLAKAREFFPDTQRTDHTIWSREDDRPSGPAGPGLTHRTAERGGLFGHLRPQPGNTSSPGPSLTAL